MTETKGEIDGVILTYEEVKDIVQTIKDLKYKLKVAHIALYGICIIDILIAILRMK